MKNLDPSQEDAYKFFRGVLDAKYTTKGDPNYKDRVLAADELIKERIALYEAHFKSTSLESLQPIMFPLELRKDLEELYAYKNKAFQKLKILVTTTKDNRVINTCQCCTIGEVNSFDHQLPQKEYPEFSAVPKNLFPSCTKCNSSKGVYWLHQGSRKFLNLYLDVLPEVQYLFVDVVINHTGLVETTFKLENRQGIEKSLFDLIVSHYHNLRLPERFSENSHSIIDDLANTITSFRLKIPKPELKDTILESVKLDKLRFGQNHWKAILEEALVNSDLFFDQYYS